MESAMQEIAPTEEQLEAYVFPLVVRLFREKKTSDEILKIFLEADYPEALSLRVMEAAKKRASELTREEKKDNRLFGVCLLVAGSAFVAVIYFWAQSYGVPPFRTGRALFGMAFGVCLMAWGLWLIAFGEDGN
jgi:uncharacterized protein YjeT (DUF2065 family)